MRKKVQIVGILNVTPDSFHDGGKFNGVVRAAERAREMIEQGADWIEVGGESTGPQSKHVALDEEIDRTIPVIKEIRRALPSAQISIDTYKSEVAKIAIQEGASMVNDVTAGREDGRMFDVLSGSSAAVVLMFAKDATPRTTVRRVEYADVIATVRDFLESRVQEANAAGIPRERIIVDPGLGQFVSSDPAYSFEILRRLRELDELECPVFVSPSRKSFLAGPRNLPTNERLPATLAASIIAAINGAEYIRTHDVKETYEALQTMQKIVQNI